MSDRLCATATTEVAVPAGEAFAFLADVANTSKWITGIMIEWQRVSDRVAGGRSLYHGAQQYVGLYPEPELLWMPMTAGADPAALLPVGAIKVIPGADTRRPEDSCLVTMMVWHVAGSGLSDEWTWDIVATNLAAQVEMIKGRLEQGF